MNNEKLFLPTVARLASLIGRRYNCEFTYQPITELRRDNLTTLRQGLAEGKPISAGDWVFFPVFVGNDLAGAGCISSRDSLSDKDLKYLNQVIRLVLEGSLNHIERLDILTGFENHMESQASNNIVQLNRFQKNLFPLPENDVTSAFNFPFLIESRSSDDIHMMAVEIHSRTNRYAMLPFEDLSPSVFTHADGLQSLGHISIFVRDVSALTYLQQEQIVKYYQSKRNKECPQIIAGSLMPLGLLKNSCKIAKELLPLLMIGYLCMSKSFEEYKRENVLDFFYDSLTGRSSD